MKQSKTTDMKEPEMQQENKEEKQQESKQEKRQEKQQESKQEKRQENKQDKKQQEKQQEKQQTQKTTLIREIFYLLRKLLVIGIFIVICQTILFGVTRNTDLGMTPSVKSGDLIFYFRRDKQYTASDVIALEVDGNFQTRRVVAIAGDIVDITEEGLVINGGLQQELNIIGETLPYTEGISFPIVLAENQVFLLGDNRENAADSRLYGAVDTEDTMGTVVIILRRRDI